MEYEKISLEELTAYMRNASVKHLLLVIMVANNELMARSDENIMVDML